jgi:ATP-dependent DNA helicase RecG
LEKFIMTRDELIQLIKEVQQHQCELDDIEVKSASSGTPQKLYQPLSAFANQTGGGVILLGLNEAQGFEIVGVSNAHRVQEEISQIATSETEKTPRGERFLDNRKFEGTIPEMSETAVNHLMASI